MQGVGVHIAQLLGGFAHDIARLLDDGLKHGAGDLPGGIVRQRGLHQLALECNPAIHIVALPGGQCLVLGDTGGRLVRGGGQGTGEDFVLGLQHQGRELARIHLLVLAQHFGDMGGLVALPQGPDGDGRIAGGVGGAVLRGGAGGDAQRIGGLARQVGATAQGLGIVTGDGVGRAEQRRPESFADAGVVSAAGEIEFTQHAGGVLELAGAVKGDGGIVAVVRGGLVGSAAGGREIGGGGRGVLAAREQALSQAGPFAARRDGHGRRVGVGHGGTCAVGWGRGVRLCGGPGGRGE